MAGLVGPEFLEAKLQRQVILYCTRLHDKYKDYWKLPEGKTLKSWDDCVFFLDSLVDAFATCVRIGQFGTRAVERDLEEAKKLMAERDRHIESLKIMCGEGDALRKRIDTLEDSLFTVTRENVALKKRMERVTLDVSEGHEKRLKTAREGATAQVHRAVENIKRTVEKHMNQIPGEVMAALVEGVDVMSTCIALNLT